MKNDILHSGKLYQFERDHIYQIHLSKISEISKKRGSGLTALNDKFLPTYPSSYKIQQELKVKEQNDRLVKKLQQISNRKKCQILMSEEDFRNNINKYIELQKSYREKYRNLREKSLQEENEKIVEKLLDKRKNERSKEEFRRDEDDYFMLKKSRSKKMTEQKNKRRETSVGSQEKSRMKRNQSLLERSAKKKVLLTGKNQQTERRRNYSTLLPTIEKMEAGSNINGVNKGNAKKGSEASLDNGELLGLLKKYERKQQGVNASENTAKDQENAQVKQADKNNNPNPQAKPKQQQLMDSLDQYEQVFEQEPIISKTQPGLIDNYKKPDNTFQSQQIKNIKKSEPIPSSMGDINKDNPQAATQKLNSNKSQKSTKSEVYLVPLADLSPMDPTLKFQKIKKKKKGKKRSTIGEVKEENQYEDEKFDLQF